MQTASEQLQHLKGTLEQMDRDIRAVSEYSVLLAVVTAGPDADSAMDGINRVAMDIKSRADDLRSFYEDAVRALSDDRL